MQVARVQKDGTARAAPLTAGLVGCHDDELSACHDDMFRLLTAGSEVH